ncbi:MAG TPA: hypothetical protein VFA11_11630 [Acidimicrobiales bacterium]|nr:hypothetical protein [Acidimicrobiales bacterium]
MRRKTITRLALGASLVAGPAAGVLLTGPAAHATGPNGAACATGAQPTDSATTADTAAGGWAGTLASGSIQVGYTTTAGGTPTIVATISAPGPFASQTGIPAGDFPYCSVSGDGSVVVGSPTG